MKQKNSPLPIHNPFKKSTKKSKSLAIFGTTDRFLELPTLNTELNIEKSEKLRKLQYCRQDPMIQVFGRSLRVSET